MNVIKNEQIENLSDLLLETNATKCFNYTIADLARRKIPHAKWIKRYLTKRGFIENKSLVRPIVISNMKALIKDIEAFMAEATSSHKYPYKNKKAEQIQSSSGKILQNHYGVESSLQDMKDEDLLKELKRRGYCGVLEKTVKVQITI